MDGNISDWKYVVENVTIYRDVYYAAVERLRVLFEYPKLGTWIRLPID